MALTAYQTLVNALVQAPGSPVALIPTANINTFINTARKRVAAEGECIRFLGTLSLTANVQAYPFSQIAIPTVGVASVFACRQAFRLVTTGVYSEIELREFEQFASYFYTAGGTGIPVRVGKLSQGSGGILYFHPIPSSSFSITLDCVGLPTALAFDTDPEPIPDLWTDAVPFLAAWYGMQYLQRQADADMMFDRYDRLMRRARQTATPTVLPEYAEGGIGAKLAASHTPLVESGAAGQRAA